MGRVRFNLGQILPNEYIKVREGRDLRINGVDQFIVIDQGILAA